MLNFRGSFLWPALREMPYANVAWTFYKWPNWFHFIHGVIPLDGMDAWNSEPIPDTRKQIGRFLREYVPNLCYQDVKMFYEVNCLKHPTVN